MHVVRTALFERHGVADGSCRRVRSYRLLIGGRGAPVRRQIRKESPRCPDRVGVVGTQVVAAATDGRVHACPAHIVEADLLSDYDLGHARRSEIHRRVAFDHEHDIAEGRDVGAPCRGRSEQAAHLRDLA